MSNEVSSRIRLLLNELAILNQPDVQDGKFIYELDTLKRIKLLTAELHLLADLLISYPAMVELLHSKIDAAAAKPQEIPAVVQPETRPAEIPVLQPQPVVVIPEPPVQITSPEPPVVMPLVEIPQPIAQPVPEPEPPVVEAVVPAAEPEPLPPPPPKVTPTANPQPVTPPSALTGASLSSKMSLTRRFEYTNLLFGGNSEAFMQFLDEVAAKDMNAAMEFFDNVAEEKNWKRKSETASDLKQLIKKLI